MAYHKHICKRKPDPGSLSNILSNIGLIAATIEARICRACRWNDEDFEYFCRHSDEIPELKKALINDIISSELLMRFMSAPALPLSEPGTLRKPLKATDKAVRKHRSKSFA